MALIDDYPDKYAFEFESAKTSKVYVVNVAKKACTCPHHALGHQVCKHLKAVFGENAVPYNGIMITKDQKAQLPSFEEYARTRLSKHFLLRDFLYSSEAEILGVPNRPSDSPNMVWRSGVALCENVLEPIIDAFGPLAITFGYQTRKVIEAGQKDVNPKSSSPHQWDRGTYGDKIYARVDILPFCVEDGEVSKEDFGHWVMHNLNIDLLMMWAKSNVFCITISEHKNRRVWLEWVPNGSGENGGNKRTLMGEFYWQTSWPQMSPAVRPKFGPSDTGGKMW